MPSFRSLILVALAVSTSYAAKCDEDFTIESDGDVAEIETCSKFEGTLTLGEGVGSVNLAGVERITGDFIVHDATALTALSADRLSIVDGDFSLHGLTVLGTLSFPQLTKVGKIDFQTLPALKNLGFTQGVTDAGSVRITDTMLGSLDGLKLTEVTNFDINNNKFLKSVDVNLSSVSEALTIAFNGKGVQAKFPELKWAQNVTVRDAGLISFPKLENVNNSIAFVNNTFETAAFPRLKTAGDFSLISCIKLTNLTANNLESVDGTFILANNTKLESVSGFQKLANVGGSIDISGALTNVTLPSLDDVRGGFNLQSTEDMSCDEFDDLGSGVVKGKYTCEGAQEVAESTEGGVSTKGDGSSSSSSSSGDDEEDAAASVAVNYGLAAALGAFTLFML